MWLRTASKDDLNEMHKLMVESWHAAYDDIIGVEKANKLNDERNSLDSLKKYMGRPSSEYVVADDGEKLHGAACAVQGAVKADPEVAVVTQLFVRPESQRQGIGARLLMELEESFPSARRIRVQVLEKNEGAVNFLESQGYKPLSVKPVLVPENDEFPTTVMEKTLF